MNSTLHRFKLLACLAFLQTVCLFEVKAQLVDDDTTAAYLASQCAVSSGISADNYHSYAESLARTMSLVSVDAQEDIFGYVPMPSGALATDAEDLIDEFQQLLDEEEGDEDEDSELSWWEKIIEWWKSQQDI